MRTVSALDVRKHLGELLDAASAGERIVIERDRRPMAVLVSYEDAQRLDEAEEDRVKRTLAALDELSAFAERMAIEHPAPDDGLDTVTWMRQERERRTDQIERAITAGRPSKETVP
jgi:prevent-host-death family protein